ncbi:TPA: RHS repeat domain-containing protein [Providencia rettgeri]
MGKNSSHYTATGLLAHQRAGRGSENFLQSLQQNPHQPPFCTDVHRSYQYDRAHNVVRIEDDRWKQTTYRYNANDQITETQYSNQIGNRDEKFLYDANLNLTEHMTLPSDAQGAMLQLFQQQQTGRVTRRDTARGYQLYHYDVNGRLEKKVVYEHGYRPKEWRYLWNTQNQLTACFTPKGDCWRYTYDAFGRRLSKTQTVDSQAAHVNPRFPQLKPKVTAWHYLWSGDQMVEETPIYADGTIAYDSQVQWLYEPGSITPTARYQNGKLHYVVTDHQGTPREIFTEAGKATWAGRLNTWGQMQFWQSRDGLADNDPNYTECHFRFAGQYEDRETGLYYNRFRYYDKDNGQYISLDPIGLLGGVNPYGYVHCPTGWVDPFGLAGCPTKGTSNDDAILGPHGTLKNDSRPGQSHHLNQDAAYRDVIPTNKGAAIKLEGNAFTEPGTPHYNVHNSLETFWNDYRRGGALYGELPTNLQYTLALKHSLQSAGLTARQVTQAVRSSIQNRLQYGLLGGQNVPRIPGRINQVKP